jgi:hypothetical protein
MWPVWISPDLPPPECCLNAGECPAFSLGFINEKKVEAKGLLNAKTPRTRKDAKFFFT